MADPDSQSIPVIDLAPFLAPAATPAERLDTADKIFAAFRVHGFIYIKNHGIPAADIATTFAQSARFFALPAATKAALAWTTPAANRGFSRMGQERVSRVEEADRVAELRAQAPDLKESFEIGRDDEPAHPNRWPPGDAAFRAAMRAFHAACAGLHRALLRALALALRLPDPAWFDGFVRRADNTLRLLHYPGVPRGALGGARARAGAHTDFGSLTLLFQDARGGLQVQGPDRRAWIDATPVPGTIVVNAGDLLSRWTNGVVRSTLHRVVEPPPLPPEEEDAQATHYPPRYSIAYFCNPDFDQWIDVVPGTLAPGEAKKFAPVNSGEYLVSRLAATY